MLYFFSTTYICVHVDIIPTWQPGVQGDAHEVMMGILNSRSALAVHIPNVIQFEMVTTGSKIDACVAIDLNNCLVICSNCRGKTETVSQSNHLSLPIYSIQVVLVHVISYFGHSCYG